MIITGSTLSGVTIRDVTPAVTTNLQLYYNPASYSGSGTSLSDLSGNGFTGTMSNIDTSNYANGYFTYNGTSSSLNTPNMVSTFNSTPAVTYEVWCYPTNIGCLVAESGAAILGTSWYDNQMEVGGDGGAPFALYASLWAGGNFSPSSPPVRTIQTNTWYQMVLTYNGTVGTGYVNGVYQGSNPSFSRSTPWDSGNGYYLFFGQSCATALYSQSWWSGRIGIIRAYNRGLSADEVSQNFNATRGIYGI